MSINEQPLVTVYIPTFNRLELLQRAIESVRNQTYKNLEIIVVDDCSTDGTQKYLEQLAKEDSRVRYFLKEKNSGACVSRNIAIENAKGEFITGLDDDDYFEKCRIEIFINAILKDPNKAYYSSNKVKISDHEIKNPHVLSLLMRSKIKSYRALLKQNFIGNQMFVKTEILQKSGGFDRNLKAWQDLECWFNLMKNQNIEVSFLKESTQIVDISHEHERITTKKLKSILEAYQYFSQKHKLSRLEKFILNGQLVGYAPEKFNFFHKFILFALTRQAFYLKKMVKK